MPLEKIAKTKMSKISQKHGNPIVAHLTTVGYFEPLCTAAKPKDAEWVREGHPEYRAVRDCISCVCRAEGLGLIEKGPTVLGWNRY